MVAESRAEVESPEDAHSQSSDQRRKTIIDYIRSRKTIRETSSLPYWTKTLNSLDMGEFRIKWTPYIPHLPTPKQLLALMLSSYREVFYGGAAGGGKSDWLLMEALQYVDVPGYAAIIFRRSLTAAQQAGGIYERFIKWMTQLADSGVLTPDMMPYQRGNTFVFPSGASLTFGYLDHDNDLEQYQSAEFQFVGFDELTHFPENRYKYLFSRLRRLTGSNVPVRMRAASNPGGRGAIWVKNRWRIKYDPVQDIHRGFHPERPMVPAFTWDNPHLDVEDYINGLLELDAVTREQLLKGNWNVAKAGRFLPKWFRRYSTRADNIILGTQQKGMGFDRYKSARYFMTVDPAASIRDTHEEGIYVRKAPSHTVIATWAVIQSHLLLWKVRRLQEEIPYVIQAIRDEYRYFCSQRTRPEFISIESNGSNLGVFQGCKHLTLPIVPYSPHAGDKITRSTDFSLSAEMGRVWLPEHSDLQAGNWLDDYEAEIFNWIGHPDEQDDQVDVSSQAGTIFNTRYAPFASSDPHGSAVSFVGGELRH